MLQFTGYRCPLIPFTGRLVCCASWASNFLAFALHLACSVVTRCHCSTRLSFFIVLFLYRTEIDRVVAPARTDCLSCLCCNSPSPGQKCLSSMNWPCYGCGFSVNKINCFCNWRILNKSITRVSCSRSIPSSICVWPSSRWSRLMYPDPDPV